MATATAEGTTATEELFLALADQPRPVAEVLALGPRMESALSQAWARGDVEFGRACHCVTGRPGVPESRPALVIEDGTDWTGPKTPRHGTFARLRADAERLPVVTEFKKYVKQVLVSRDEQGTERWRTATAEELQEEGRELRWATQKIERPEAVALMALQVQLTDKGLAALQL